LSDRVSLAACHGAGTLKAVDRIVSAILAGSAHMRKPALDLSDVVWQPSKFNTGNHRGRESRHGRRNSLGRAERSSPMPHGGAPKARGLTASARAERSSMFPRCASSSDAIRKIKYRDCPGRCWI